MCPHEDEPESRKAKPDAIPQPAVASFSRSYTAEGRGQRIVDIAERVEIVLKELGAAVRQGGGFIGHIKTFISFTEGPSIAMSVVKDKVDHQPYDSRVQDPTSGFKVAVTAIVYGFTNEELARLLNLGLAIGLPESVCRPVQAETRNLKPIAPFVS